MLFYNYRTHVHQKARMERDHHLVQTLAHDANLNYSGEKTSIVFNITGSLIAILIAIIIIVSIYHS